MYWESFVAHERTGDGLSGLSGVLDTLPKKFQNSFTKLTVNATGLTFKIGDYVVASAKSRGFIVAVGTNAKGQADGSMYLSDSSTVDYKKIKHAEPPTPPFYMRPHARKRAEEQIAQPQAPSADYERLMSENIVLRRKLAECEGALSAPSRELPPSAADAPEEVKALLPEVRQEELTETIQTQVEELAQISQTGTPAEIREAEQNIQESINELKQVAAQTTISASAGCRVILSTAKSRTGEVYGTVRIYFEEKPDKEVFTVMARNGFKSYEDKEISTRAKPVWYFGCRQDANGKKLAFANEYCGTTTAKPDEYILGSDDADNEDDTDAVLRNWYQETWLPTHAMLLIPWNGSYEDWYRTFQHKFDDYNYKRASKVTMLEYFDPIYVNEFYQIRRDYEQANGLDRRTSNYEIPSDVPTPEMGDYCLLEFNAGENLKDKYTYLIKITKVDLRNEGKIEFTFVKTIYDPLKPIERPAGEIPDVEKMDGREYVDMYKSGMIREYLGKNTERTKLLLALPETCPTPPPPRELRPYEPDDETARPQHVRNPTPHDEDLERIRQQFERQIDGRDDEPDDDNDRMQPSEPPPSTVQVRLPRNEPVPSPSSRPAAQQPQQSGDRDRESAQMLKSANDALKALLAAKGIKL